MRAAHEEAAPDAVFVSDEKVPVRRLDDWFAENGSAWSRVALKIDTQGFEREVLAGTAELLDSSVVSIQLELSLAELYEGSWLWFEAVAWLTERGYALAGLTPGFTDPRSGRLLQFDGVFVAARPDAVGETCT